MSAQPQTKAPLTKVITGRARLSYVTLFVPRASEDGGDPKYSVAVLIPKSDKVTVAKINAAVEAAKQAGAGLWGGKVPAGLKTPLRDGDTERDGDEYKGHWFLNASSKNKPGVVDSNVQPVMDASEVYSGCYGRVSINFYPFNAKGNRGVAAGLQNVQKLDDGEPLSGHSTPENDFTSSNDDFLS